MNERQDDQRDAAADAHSKWDKLGEAWIQGKNSTVTINVGKKPEKYTRLRFDIEHADLEIYDILIVFGSGQKYEPKTRLRFREGSSTGTVDFPGEARTIDHVEIKASNVPGSGRAQVELWGLGTGDR